MSVTIKGNRIPLYHQVAQSLKQRVRTGEYQKGQSLPSLRNLSREFGVSVNVIQQAIYHLEKEGIVVAQHGKNVLIAEDEPCQRAAIFFGFIHPYSKAMSFHQQVLANVTEAFAERSNFVVVHSSNDDRTRERQAAEHLLANGVKGLILWPASDDTNGEYFTQLSKTIPVVVVDRMLAGAELPYVVLDFEQAGRDVCRCLLENMKKKRLLVLVDNLPISGYQWITKGLEQAAHEMGRATDITVVQLPITRVLQNINTSDFHDVDTYGPHVADLLEEGKYDAVFCTQDEFIEYVLVDTGIADRFAGIQLSTLRGKAPNSRSRKYRSFGILDVLMDSTRMVSQAADIVQDWVLSRQPSRDQIRLKMDLLFSNAEQDLLPVDQYFAERSSCETN